MKENKQDIINYINSCTNCYSSVLSQSKAHEVMYIRYKKAFQDVVIMAVKQSKKEVLENSFNRNISITFWSRIKGYQIKGVIADQGVQKYHQEHTDFKNSLLITEIDLTDLHLVACEISKIYTVTPGKKAGQLISA